MRAELTPRLNLELDSQVVMSKAKWRQMEVGTKVVGKEHTQHQGKKGEITGTSGKGSTFKISVDFEGVRCVPVKLVRYHFCFHPPFIRMDLFLLCLQEDQVVEGLTQRHVDLDRRYQPPNARRAGMAFLEACKNMSFVISFRGVLVFYT